MKYELQYDTQHQYSVNADLELNHVSGERSRWRLRSAKANQDYVELWPFSRR